MQSHTRCAVLCCCWVAASSVRGRTEGGEEREIEGCVCCSADVRSNSGGPRSHQSTDAGRSSRDPPPPEGWGPAARMRTAWWVLPLSRTHCVTSSYPLFSVSPAPLLCSTSSPSGGSLRDPPCPFFLSAAALSSAPWRGRERQRPTTAVSRPVLNRETDTTEQTARQRPEGLRLAANVRLTLFGEVRGPHTPPPPPPRGACVCVVGSHSTTHRRPCRGFRDF